MEIHHEQSYKAEIILRHRSAVEVRRRRLPSGHWVVLARKTGDPGPEAVNDPEE